MLKGPAGQSPVCPSMLVDPESRIEVSLVRQYAYHALIAEGRVSGLDGPYFVASLQEDGYYVVWPVRDDVRAFIKQVDDFRIDTGADESPVPALGLVAGEEPEDISVIWRPSSYKPLSADAHAPRTLYGLRPGEERRNFRFDEAGAKLWDDPEGFLAAAGVENLVSVTIALPGGAFQMLRHHEEGGHLYRTAIVFHSDRECPERLACALHFTHTHPLRQDRYTPALAQVIRDYRGQLERHYPRPEQRW